VKQSAGHQSFESADYSDDQRPTDDVLPIRTTRRPAGPTGYYYIAMTTSYYDTRRSVTVDWRLQCVVRSRWSLFDCSSIDSARLDRSCVYMPHSGDSIWQ